MSEWISKAANVFKRDVPETPQPFEVSCECGQVHSGMRRIRYQHLVCKSCGASIFVLPRDTYPPPHVAKKSSKKKRRKKKRKKEVTPIPIDFSEPIVEPDQPKERQPVPKAVYEEELGPGFFSRKFSDSVDFVVAFKEAFFGYWTPYRKLALLIFVCLGITAFYSYRQSVLRQASRISRENYDAGLAEIGEENWTQAREEFLLAADAVDQLGRTDLEANRIRQFARETTAMTRLSDATLIDIVEDAEKTYVASGMDAWQRKFKMSYRNEWFIIEGTLRPNPDFRTNTGDPALELVFPWVVGTRPREVIIIAEFPLAINLPRIAETTYDDASSSTALFGVQVSNCTLDHRGDWVVYFVPETAFFWVNRETYAPTNLEIGSIRSQEEFEEMLSMQANWMGVRE